MSSFSRFVLAARAAAPGVPPASRPHRLMTRNLTGPLAKQLDQLALGPVRPVSQHQEPKGHKVGIQQSDSVSPQPDEDVHLTPHRAAKRLATCGQRDARNVGKRPSWP
jgi:hypothetical protein